MGYFLELFDRYTQASWPGVVIFADHYGVAMYGAASPDAKLPYDSNYDRVAYGWGNYLAIGKRGVGISSQMRELARRNLRRQGIDTVIAGIVAPAATAQYAKEGAVPDRLTVVHRLGDK